MNLLSYLQGSSCTPPRSRPAGSAGRPTRGSTGWPTPGRSWWQMLPLGPPDRHGSPYKSRVGVRGLAGACWRSRARPCPRAERARLPRAQRGLDRGLDRFRAAAWTTRCGSTASGRALRALRGRARRAADRRHPDLRRGGLGRPSRAPGDLPRRRGRRRAARRVHRQGPAVGQPAVRLAGDAPRRLPLVDRALPPHVRALRPRADRPLPRLRRLLGGAGDGAVRAARAAGSAGRAARRSTRRARCSASCR